jgi:hypothetical protein
MAQVELEGTVPNTFDKQDNFNMKVAEKDINKAIIFFEHTTTVFRGNVAVWRQDIVNSCKAGDYIKLTICTNQRSDGISIKTIGFKKLKSA